jgi:anaerobic magnesium-protoporphyrin IX monomethyl ester cyclase
VSKRLGIIDLVVPYIEENFIPVSRSGIFPPLGLLSIATQVTSEVLGVDIVIWDGNIKSESEIQIRENAEIVGFSPSILSYIPFLNLARRAKENGSFVVVGGYHASALGKRILENNNYIDFVIRGDGEIPFTELVKGTHLNDIPGLIYRVGEGIRCNPICNPPLDTYRFPDRSLISHGEYNKRFLRKYGKNGFHIADIIYSQKDCVWSSKTGGCVFCGRIDRDYRSRNPKLVWEEIRRLKNEFGVDYIWDVSGSFTGNPDWLNLFHKFRVEELGVSFEIYARSPEITPDIAAKLRDIGIYKVFIGVDSGDAEILKKAGKGSTPKINSRAVNECAVNNIVLTLGVVIGLPGENGKSLDNTLKHIKQLVSQGDVETISSAVLLPVPGSRAFEILSGHPKTKGKYEKGDYWDLEEMQRDWLKLFTTIPYDVAISANEEVLKYAPTQSALIRFGNNASKSTENQSGYVTVRN